MRKLKTQHFENLSDGKTLINHTIYSAMVKDDLTKLITEVMETSGNQEKKIQQFFEEYPSALRGALEAIPSSHQIFGNIIISQPRLKGLKGDRQPDFLIVTWNSLNLFFNFIEIEDPKKKIIAYPNVALTGNFTQAFGQLKQWHAMESEEVREYCNELKITLFKENFNINDKRSNYNYILILGHSEEFRSYDARYNDFLQNYIRPPFFHCTYSRVIKNYYTGFALLSVKKDSKTNLFKAIGMTPFLRYSTDEWSDFHNVSDKAEIISKSPFIMATQKIRLIKEIEKLDNLSLEKITQIILNDPGMDIDNDIDNALGF